MNELANLVAQAIINEKADKSFIESNKEDRISLALAYAEQEVKKFEQFALKMQTNDAANKAFSKYVMSIL